MILFTPRFFRHNPALVLPNSACPIMQTSLDELKELASGAQNRRTETGIPRVAMVKGAIREHELTGVYEPMVNMILQGGKTMSIGERVIHFDHASYFVMSIDVPATGTVHQGGPGQPYLAVSLTLDASAISSMLEDMPEDGHLPHGIGGFSVCPVTPELLDAWVRMLRLMRNSADIPVLSKGYEREILYRVLQGPQGWMLREIGRPGSALSRIRNAIKWIRGNYTEPIHVEHLADVAGLSLSAFHRRFKSVTAMSPIQFQKKLRLLQARSLLLSTSRHASVICFEVGYESASQFNREYSHQFGLPPATDIARIRAERSSVVH
jgi:AraC-like DNA-binding protein